MITIVFGGVGSGKTAYLQRLAVKYHKKREVYANCDLAFCHTFHTSSLGFRSFPRGSLILIDEAGVEYNNRSFKSLPIQTIEYLKLHRHYGVDIVVVSQAYDDMDITFRRLADRFYHIKKIGPFSLIRPINHRITIDRETEQIIDGYKFGSIFSFRAFPIPRYTYLYRSFCDDPRNLVEAEYCSPPVVRRPLRSYSYYFVYAAFLILFGILISLL